MRPLGGPGFEVVENVRATVERHDMLRSGDVVVTAVSGGPDSTCLLDVLARLAPKFDWTLHVAHVDHGLSEASEEVAARVAGEAAAAGFEVHVVRAPDLEGPNLHARARAFRYAFFETIAGAVGARRIATGHTLDDRVETTLARLVHGAGTKGLAGIPPARGPRVRPLIELRRHEARDYCEELGLGFFDDPANDDERFERAAVRNEVVAAIEARWGAGAVRAMATSSQRLHEDARTLATLAKRLYGELAVTEEGRVSFDRAALEAIPTGLRRRLLERAVGRVRDRAGGIDAALQALEEEARGGAERRDRSFDVASGVTIEVAKESVIVRLPDLVPDGEGN